MLKITKTIILLVLILPMLVSQVSGGIVRVVRRYSVIDFYGGTSSPVGSYDNLAGSVTFFDEHGRLADVDGDVLFNPTTQFGISYGWLRSSKMLLTIGFRWTKVDAVSIPDLNTVTRKGLAIFFDPKKPDLNQYDLDFNFNYLFMDIADQGFTPFVGVGFRAGATKATARGYSAETDVNTVLAANAGVELKVWEDANKRSFVTVASVNSYDMFASGDRPKYLNIGAAVKIYFRL